MKTIIYSTRFLSILLALIILFPLSVSAQLIPVRGWENKDSIRFGAWGPVPNGNEVSPYDDTLGVNI